MSVSALKASTIANLILFLGMATASQLTRGCAVVTIFATFAPILSHRRNAGP